MSLLEEYIRSIEEQEQAELISSVDDLAKHIIEEDSYTVYSSELSSTLVNWIDTEIEEVDYECPGQGGSTIWKKKFEYNGKIIYVTFTGSIQEDNEHNLDVEIDFNI